MESKSFNQDFSLVCVWSVLPETSVVLTVKLPPTGWAPSHVEARLNLSASKVPAASDADIWVYGSLFKNRCKAYRQKEASRSEEELQPKRKS